MVLRIFLEKNENAKNILLILPQFLNILMEEDILTMITTFKSYKTETKKTFMDQNETLYKIWDRSVQPFYRDAATYIHTAITLYILI